MKKKRGFTLKSGNNLGAKGRNPSNFKMMGASPAKRTDVFKTTFDPDTGEETVERIGTGDEAIKKGIASEKANQRKQLANEKLKSAELSDIRKKLVAIEEANPDSMDFINSPEYKALEKQQEDIEQGRFEGGLRQGKVSYTLDEAKKRRGIERGKQILPTGEYPTKQEITRGTTEFGDQELQDEMIQKIKSQKGMPMKKGKRGFQMKRKK